MLPRVNASMVKVSCYEIIDLWTDHLPADGPYSGFAGRDASRGLATFSVETVTDEYDDLSDLKPSEMEQVQEWELQFSEKYDLVGKLLKPGEESRLIIKINCTRVYDKPVSGLTVTSPARKVMRAQSFSRNPRLRRRMSEAGSEIQT